VARFTDPNLVNPSGMASSPTGPFWYTDAGSGVSDLRDGRGQMIPLVVTAPPPAAGQDAPSGTVFNAGSGFVVTGHGASQASLFLFAGLDGTITAWAPAVDPAQAVLAAQGPAGSAYTGLALASGTGGNSFLYAADFGLGTIDVFNERFQPVTQPGAFQDPNLPSTYAPFNVQALDHLLFVTYAQKDTDGGYAVPGAGSGIIDVYSSDGTLVKRFASGGALNAPWGLALAPSSFGPLGGALLVGNNGDGQINAYDPSSGTNLGPLTGDNGLPISIPGLWSLAFGNDHEGGASDTLFFVAGTDDQYGLFGAIQSPQRRGADTGGAGAFDPSFPGERADYPLPPPDGPALQADQEALLTVSTLLPLAEASLALVPTLVTFSPAGAHTASPTGASVVAVSLDRPAATALLASGTVFVLPAAPGDQLTATETPSNVAGLNRLLDVNPLPEAPLQIIPAQQPVTSQQAFGPSNSTAIPAPTPDIQLPSPRVLAREIRATESQRSERWSPPSPTERLPEAALATARLEVFSESSMRGEALPTRSRMWKKVLTAVFPVLSIAVVWTALQRHRRRMKTRGQRLVRLQRTVSYE